MQHAKRFKEEAKKKYYLADLLLTSPKYLSKYEPTNFHGFHESSVL